MVTFRSVALAACLVLAASGCGVGVVGGPGQPGSGPTGDTPRGTRSAASKKADIAWVDAMIDQHCISHEGRRWVHQQIQKSWPRGGATPAEILDLIEEAAHTRAFTKAGTKCAIRQARRFKTVAKRLGPFGLAVTIVFFAETARAEGICYAVADATPGVDVVLHGVEVFSEIADIRAQWHIDEVNNNASAAHVIASQLLAANLSIDGWDKDPYQVADAVRALYDALQSVIYQAIEQRQRQTGRSILRDTFTRADWDAIKAAARAGIDGAVDDYRRAVRAADLPKPLCHLVVPPPPCNCDVCADACDSRSE